MKLKYGLLGQSSYEESPSLGLLVFFEITLTIRSYYQIDFVQGIASINKITFKQVKVVMNNNRIIRVLSRAVKMMPWKQPFTGFYRITVL